MKYSMVCTLLFFPWLICSTVVQALDVTDTADWYIGHFGVVEESSEISRIRAIFNNVKNASSRIPDAKLIVLKGDTGWNGHAVALPDNNVVVSENTIVIVYRNVPNVIGDARMAFIFGHELAHQSENDFSEHIYAFSSASAANDRFEKELEADRLGFIYATIAGYDTHLLLGNSDRKSFIEYWVEATRSVSGVSDRAGRLNRNFRLAKQKVELFKYGVRLAHFGGYDDAIQLLKAFEQTLPSREVLTNLGYSYLQKARQKMPDKIAYRFWFPTWLENKSGLKFDSRSWYENAEMPPDAIGYLESARRYLEDAVRINADDITSRINLVAVYLYLQKEWKAMDMVNEATDIYQRAPQGTVPEHLVKSIKGLRALCLYLLDSEVDTFETAKKYFETVIKSPTVPDHVLYNYGRMLQERHRSGASKLPWNRLLARLQHLPVDYRRALCRETNERECQLNAEILQPDVKLFALPLNDGDDVDKPSNRDQLRNWLDSGGARIGSVNTRTFIAPNGDSILAIDNLVEMAAIVQQPFQSTAHLQQVAGDPMVRYPVANGEIWSYGSDWSALISGDDVVEIWISAP